MIDYPSTHPNLSLQKFLSQQWFSPHLLTKKQNPSHLKMLPQRCWAQCLGNYTDYIDGRYFDVLLYFYIIYITIHICKKSRILRKPK